MAGVLILPNGCEWHCNGRMWAYIVHQLAGHLESTAPDLAARLRDGFPYRHVELEDVGAVELRQLKAGMDRVGEHSHETSRRYTRAGVVQAYLDAIAELRTILDRLGP